MRWKSMITIFLTVTTALACLSINNIVFAGEWPEKEIRIIVGWGPGGTTDLSTRMLAESIRKKLKVPVIVENKPGGSSILALKYVSEQKPDGYTIGAMAGYSFTDRPWLKGVPFDPEKSFTFICKAYQYGYGFVVQADSPYKTMKDFVEAAKQKPGELSVSFSGVGSPFHLSILKMEKNIPGFKVKKIPYKGGLAAVTSLLGGHVDGCLQSTVWKPYVEAGKLRLLAVAQKKRMPEFPDVPTLIEAGYNEYIVGMNFYATPGPLPENIRMKLEQAFKEAMDYPRYKDILKKFALIEAYQPGKELYEEIVSEYRKNEKLIPQLGISFKQ